MMRLRRWVQKTSLRTFDFVAHARWILLSVVLAAVGLADVWGSVPRLVTLSLAIVSFVLLGVEWRRHREQLNSLAFPDPTGIKYEGVAAACSSSSRFTFVELVNGHVVLDREAGDALARGLVTASLARHRYVLPDEIKDAGLQYRRERVSRPGTYNDPLVGLDTDLGITGTLATTDWTLVPATYWDHLASDIMASKEATRRGRPVLSLGQALYVDRHQRLRDLGASWLLNGVGTSMLALTTDRRLVVVHQTTRNESSGGLLAPSSSGSLEPRDFPPSGVGDMAKIAIDGAIRELGEETGIAKVHVLEAAVLGFGRWLDKAGKPEIWSVARLDLDSHAVARCRVSNHEKVFTTGSESVHLDELASWDPERPADMLPNMKDAPYFVSVPLMVGLRLAAEESRKPNSTAGTLIRRALASPS